MTAPDKDGWITRKPSDPIPECRVKVRLREGTETDEFLPVSAFVWREYGAATIVAYLPESPPQETEADRIARCAPQLVEALGPFAKAYDFWSGQSGGVSDDTEIDDQGKITMGDLRRARQALSEAGIEL